MALSPNYGWSEPDNSSLVKNGAADIRTLGDAIDTSVWNVGFGQAGKNKIINGDFTINQRNFSSTTTTGQFGPDRWFATLSDGTVTYSIQQFALGTAPVAGYEGKQYVRLATTGQTLTTATTLLGYAGIEGVRTFAGQTVTVSFWAKSDSGTPKIALQLRQNFGSGGSPSSTVTNFAGTSTLSTSWARYSITYTMPSIAGKTLGTNGNDRIQVYFFTSAGSGISDVGSIGIQNNTIDIWGVQVMYGSKATPFQTATGTIQGELAACQRYYYRNTTGSNYGVVASGSAGSTTAAVVTIQLPVPMRVKPTSVESANLELGDNNNAGSAVTAVAINTNVNNSYIAALDATVASGLTQYRYYNLRASNNTSAYLGLSAEL